MNHPYQVLGASVPAMLGRVRLVQQIERHILKPSPDHVSVVGPARYGKSVLLHGLALRHAQGSPRYVTAGYVDLRHAPPASDRDLRRRFGEVVKSALAGVRPEVAGLIELDDPCLHELLDLAFQELDGQGARLLIVLDGFDHVLAGTGITRTLWDQLRSLGQKGSLRLVTGSRRPLRELCKTEESRTSDFWEIFFDTPVGVGPFEEEDWDVLIEPLLKDRRGVDGAARKELANWSGGVPVLAAALLERLAESGSDAPVTKSDVDREADAILDERRQLLEMLWGDCGVELRADLGALAECEADGIPSAELPDGRRRVLESRGFGRISGNRMRPSCRLMTRFAAQQAPAAADIRRLFGAPDRYDSNIRAVLELRTAQVLGPDVDRELRSCVEGAVRDLGASPETSLKWVRSIATRALTLVWDAEFGRNNPLPAEWIAEWQQAGVKWSDDSGRIPRRYGAQCGLLNLATGTDRVRRVARFVTKPTYLLIDHLQSVGDFGQHREDFPESRVSVGTAAAFVLSAIELAEQLTRDLAGRDRPGAG
ncbi:MAG: hypothetical protein FJ087_12290 [Deltaproteobacteria bacterium]|nr:hypothetical protein [Deltaproteobacteria bacterium]